MTDFSSPFAASFDDAFGPLTPSGRNALVGGLCYPDSTDWGCAYSDEEIALLDPVVMARSEALAWSTLSSLTGYQVATCPIEVRPCSEACLSGTWIEAPVTGGGSGFTPGINSQGYWVNSCGCSKGKGCSCTALSEVILPGPVGGIVEVLLDGDVVDPGSYRVDNGNRLLAQYDVVWPACQDMRIPSGLPDTFSVRYWRGFAPNALTNYAAGVLAAEFYRACTGGKCRLPNGVTQLTRQGVTVEIQTGMFVNGYTGIREVDAIIQTYNPNGLRMAPTIASPDENVTRTPTWRW